MERPTKRVKTQPSMPPTPDAPDLGDSDPGLTLVSAEPNTVASVESSPLGVLLPLEIICFGMVSVVVTMKNPANSDPILAVASGNQQN